MLRIRNTTIQGSSTLHSTSMMACKCKKINDGINQLVETYIMPLVVTINFLIHILS